MLKLVRAEFAKMRRSSMFLVGFAGAAVTPLVSFAGIMLYRSGPNAEEFTVNYLLNETNLFNNLLIGPALYGLLGSWMVIREFSEGTLRNILPIPVSRARFLAAKFLALLVWILVLSLWSWILAATLAALGGLDGWSLSAVAKYIAPFLFGGALLFLLSSPFLFAALALRNLVPVIAIIVSLTLVSVVIGNSAYQPIYPWTAIIPIVSGKPSAGFPPYAPYLSLFATSFAGFVLSFIRFCRMDIP
ncbi:MAG TPA: ABC transporter permease [Treponemataceae bacterium]|mgnify:CR=1 FL=1|nr:ABC transporter permease [Treponemataceae bacterium]